MIKVSWFYQSPSLKEIREICKTNVDNLWDEIKRFDNLINIM